MWTRIAPILFLAGLTPALALTGEGFRTPSGNIQCKIFVERPANRLRCELIGATHPLPPRPPWCTLDFGRALEVTTASRGERACHGEIAADAALPVLEYGGTWQHSGITCVSAEAGLFCRNARGSGFDLARERQRLF